MTNGVELQVAQDAAIGGTSPLSAHSFTPDHSTWRAAYEEIWKRKDSGEQSLERTQMLLAILANSGDTLPDFSVVDLLLNGFRLRDPSVLAALATTYSATRINDFEEKISAVAQRLSDKLSGKPELHLGLDSGDFAPLIDRSMWKPLHYLRRDEISYDRLRPLFPDRQELQQYYGNLMPRFIGFSASRWLLSHGDKVPDPVLQKTLECLEDLPDSVDKVPLYIIGKTAAFVAIGLHLSAKSKPDQGIHLISNYLRASAELEKQHPIKTPSEPGIYQNENHESSFAKLSEAGEVSRATQSIRAERLASDRIRLNTIPLLLSEEGSFSEAYWKIHRERFSQGPTLVQNYGTDPYEINSYVIYATKKSLYQRNVGRLREGEVCCEEAFLHLPARYLPEVSVKFFNALEDLSCSFGAMSRERLTDILTITQAFLTLAHLPFDGAGRTNEDFLVYCARRAGSDFSLSRSGYRHHLSPLAERFQRQETRFKYEFDKNCIEQLSIPKSGFNSANWYTNVDKVMREVVFGGDTGFKVYKTGQAIAMIDALSNPSVGLLDLSVRYPSLTGIRATIAAGLDEHYLTPSSQAANRLDELIAESLVTPPFIFRTELLREKPLLTSDPLGAQFLSEHLKNDRRFVSRKLQNHYAELLVQLEGGPPR